VAWEIRRSYHLFFENIKSEIMLFMEFIPKEKLLEIYDQFPQKIKEALFSYENAMLNLKICKHFGIPKEKVSDLASEVGWVLMGFYLPKDLPMHLTKTLEIPPETASKIYRILNREIFFPLREEIKQTQEIVKKAGLLKREVEENKPSISEIEKTVNLRESSKERKEEKLRRERALKLAEVIKEIKKEKQESSLKKENFPEEKESPLESVSKPLKPKFEIPGVKPKIKPIADIEKPKIEFEEIEEKEEPLFGKIEFPGGKKIIKKEKLKPEIKEIEYKVSKPKSPFEKPIDFSKL